MNWVMFFVLVWLAIVSKVLMMVARRWFSWRECCWIMSLPAVPPGTVQIVYHDERGMLCIDHYYEV